jgi:hypothetical protein
MKVCIYQTEEGLKEVTKSEDRISVKDLKTGVVVDYEEDFTDFYAWVKKVKARKIGGTV